jgi:hypothetical protein
MHFVQPSSSFMMSSEKNCWGWVQTQSCTASLNSSSANRESLTAPSRGPNWWKTKGVRSRPYVEWLRTSNFSSWRLPLVWTAVWGQALPCKTWTLQIIFLPILCKWLASAYFITCQNTLHLLPWFHIPGNVEGHDLDSPKTLTALTSQMVTESWSSRWQEMMRASTAHFDFCSVIHIGVSKSHLSAKVGTNFANRLWSFGQYSSLVD